jgi:hypothetical protein
MFQTSPKSLIGIREREARERETREEGEKVPIYFF